LALGIPTFLLNPDALPGRANQYLAGHKQVAHVFAQWEASLSHFPAHAPVTVAGCPVRRSFLEAGLKDRAELLRRFDLDPARRTLLVTGASQGARTINEAMALLAGRLDWAGWQVLHLAGGQHADWVKAAYARVTKDGACCFRARVLAFTDRMAEALAAADLVVSRAGASSLAEILVLGKPCVLMPYPFHRDQHQRVNAEVLADAGAAVIVEDGRQADENRRRLEPVLRRLMRSEQARAAMARAAAGLARPDAGAVIARHLTEVAQRGASGL
jgi:UDP-N-acetylglucosamine--N-acetylmuramyl-(pentapeptide) pyrophosphoryl-undecaprenol N-acetylglucosamine transferase